MHALRAILEQPIQAFNHPRLKLGPKWKNLRSDLFRHIPPETNLGSEIMVVGPLNRHRARNCIQSMSRAAAGLARRLKQQCSSRRGLKTTVPSSYATVSPLAGPSTSAYEVFDEPSKTRQRDRAIIRLKEESGATGGPSVIDYVREELAERLVDRVEVRITRST